MPNLYPVNPSAIEAFQGIAPVDDLVSGKAGVAKFTITPNSGIQKSSYGLDSFTITNIGDKRIAAVYIDITNALYPDTVFDPQGLAGDTVARGLQFSNTGGTGVYVPVSDPKNPNVVEPFYGVGGVSGYEGMRLIFNPDPNVAGGFNPGESVVFGVDLDANSIVGLPQQPIDINGNDPRFNKWDIGGVSGAELINSKFIVLFTDGTTAVGEVFGDGSQGGGVAIASQASPNKQVNLTVNGLNAGASGTYSQSDIQILVSGQAGDTARIVLTKGFIQPFVYTNPSGNIIDLSTRFVDSPFPANNAVQFQTVDVLLTGGQQNITSLFNLGSPGGVSFAGSDQLPIGVVAAVVDGTTKLPLGPVNEPIYLQYQAVVGNDTIAPTATATVSNVTTAGGTSYSFTVVFSDNQAVSAATLNGNEVVVTGPNGFSQQATLVSLSSTSNGSPLTATYQITPPGGSWQSGDAGAYTIALQPSSFTDTSGNPNAAATLGTFQVNPIIPPPAATPAIRINAGGSAYTDTSGNQWVADSFFSGGKTYSTTTAIAGTTQDPIYQTERYGNFSYAIPVANGTYDINLLLAEIYWQNPSARVFDVFIEGQQLVDDLDIFAAAGLNSAYQLNLTGVAVADGVLDLSFVTELDNAKLSGIEIFSSGGGEVPPPPPPPPGDTTPPTATATVSNVTTAGGTSYSFTVVFSDTQAVSAATLNGNEVVVTGPNGFSQQATLVSLSSTSNGSPLTATYQITPPGGSWQSGDAGAYTIALQPSSFTDTSGNLNAAATLGTFTVNPITPPPAATPAIRINAGGSAYTDTSGNQWVADSFFSGGKTYSTTTAIAGTTQDPIYQTERYGNFSYAIPVANGTYDINLLLAEIYWQNPSARVFDVFVEGQQLVDDLDIFAAAGLNSAYQLNLTGVAVADGVLDLSFVTELDNAKLSGIEIFSSGGGEVPPPPPPPPGDTTPPTATATVSNVTTAGGTSYSFTVVFSDTQAVSAATLNGNEVVVTGPNGFSQQATLVSLSSTSNGSPLTATYQITPPGGSWQSGDAGAYTIALQPSSFTDTSGNPNAAATLGTFQVSLTTTPPVTTAALRINAGGGAYIDTSSNQWVADQYFLNGNTYSTTAPIFKTENDPIYQTERWAPNLQYSIPVANGNYLVNLHFAEIYHNDFNKRVFDVFIEGNEAFEDVDIFARSKNAFFPGQNSALVLSQSAVSVTDGQLDINFISSIENAQLSGIEIISLMGPQVIFQGINGNTIVSEAGLTDAYTVVLNSQPSTDVVVNINLANDGQLTINQPSLTFTPNNWNIAQTVTVGAVDDNLKEGTHFSTIAHTIASADPDYSGLTLASVAVTIIDNDVVPIVFNQQKTIATGIDPAGGFGGPTRGTWGPDGRLYVGTYSGVIKAYTLSDNYEVTAVETIATIAGLSNPNILGLAFNPWDNDGSGAPKLYVAHSQLYANGGSSFPVTQLSPYSGQVSILEGPNFSTLTPLITGLPVSNHDHGINGLDFDNEGNLYIASGGNTNAGITAGAIGGIPESPFTAAILKAEITKPDFNGTITYELPNNFVPPNGLTFDPALSQVFGDQAKVVSGVDVSVYASGFRNPFDLVFATNGLMYATDNGANAGFGDQSTSATTQQPYGNIFDADELNLVIQGAYYGHPNRSRGMEPGEDRQNVFYSSEAPDIPGVHTAPIAKVAASTNGLEEYRATTFGGQLRGQLFAQKWNGQVYGFDLSADGMQVENTVTYNFTNGLDLLTGPGGVFVNIDLSANAIKVAIPDDISAVGMTAFDIFPWRAPAVGGGSFVIGGQDFNPADTLVIFGGQAASITSVSASRIEGIFPTLLPDPSDGFVDLVVQSGGKVSTITNAFLPLV